jgi:hypothetical protein
MTLEHAAWDGLNWQIQAVDYNITETGYLALDQNDNPHIDYHVIGLPHGSLRYASWSGAEWLISTVGPDSKSYASGPLVVDSKGTPHITYLGSDNAEAERTVYCMYATLKSESGTTSVDSTGSMKVTSEMVIVPIIVFAVLLGFVLWRRKIKKRLIARP